MKKQVSTKENKSRSRFFSGVLALTLANIFVKAVGLLLKIPLRNILGDGGMVYYNNAYEIYAFLFTVSTVGLPTAVAMLISEDRAKGNLREAKKIFKVATILFVAIGAIGTCIMFFGAPLFEEAYKINDSAYTIMAVAPTLFFICITSAFRGYFQGYQNMVPTAISEVIEAIGKMALGLLFANYAISQGEPVHIVAAYAALGLTVGIAAGMLFLIVRKLLFHPQKYDLEYGSKVDDTLPVRKSKTLIRALFMIAIPITLSSSVLSLSTLLDGIILSRGLQSISYTENAVKEMIGNFRTCVTPITNLILALVAPITSSIIPLISSTRASGDKKRVKNIFDSTLRVTIIVILPCVFGIAALSEPIIQFIFGDATSAQRAAPLLSIMIISVFFMSMISVSAATLQAHKLEKKPIISVAVGSLVKVVLTYALVMIPALNIKGSPISSIVSCLVISAMNFYFIRKHIGFTPNFPKLIIRPLISAFICALTALGAYKVLYSCLGLAAALLVSVMIAAIGYILAIFLLRAVGRDEIEMLPKGKSLVSFLTKMKLLK